MTDQFGGWSRHSYNIQIYSELSKLIRFVEGNELLYVDFNDFVINVNISFDSIVKLSKIQNNYSTTLKSIPNYFLGKWLLYADPDDMFNLLITNQITKLNYNSSDFGFKSIEIMIKNFEKSISVLNKLEQNSFFRAKINKYVSNFSILLSVLEVENYNNLISSLIKIFSNYKYLEKTSVIYFRKLVIYRYGDISIKDLKVILSLKSKFWKNYIWQSFDLTPLYTDKRLKEEKKKFVNNYINSVGSNKRLRDEKYTFLELFDIIDLCLYQDRKRIGSLITKKLKSKFNFDSFLKAVLSGVIKFEDWEEEYLEKFPIEVVNYDHKYLRGRMDETGRRLQEFILIAYKFNFDLNKTKYLDLKMDDPYFNWLYDPEKYNYKNFDFNWLLRYNSLIYFFKFKSIETMKKEFKNYLIRNPHLELNNIFLSYFVN